MNDGRLARVLLLTGFRQSLITVGKPEQGGHCRYGAGSLRQLLKILSPGAQLSGGPGEHRSVVSQF